MVHYYCLYSRCSDNSVVYAVKESTKPKKEYKNKRGEMLDDAPKVLVFKALAVGIVMRFLVLIFTGV